MRTLGIKDKRYSDSDDSKPEIARTTGCIFLGDPSQVQQFLDPDKEGKIIEVRPKARRVAEDILA